VAVRIQPSNQERWGYNYNRVMLADGTMEDHIGFLKRAEGIPEAEEFSVWELVLGAGLILKSALEARNVDVLLVNYVDDHNEARAFGDIQRFGPDLVVLSTTFILSPAQLQQATQKIRRYLPTVFVVAGGHHVFITLMGRTDRFKTAYLKATPVDAFLEDGQGEESLLKLVEAFPGRLETVPNLTWKDPEGGLHCNPRVKECGALKPLQKFDGIAPGAVVHVRTARGCAFSCAFCSYPSTGGAWEYLEVEEALLTLEEAKRAGAGAVIFTDDTFNVPKERFLKLLEGMIERGLVMPWYSFLRCQFVDEHIVQTMKRSGCRGVFLGIESGSDKVLANIGKGAKVAHYRQGIAWLKAAGITTVGSFLFGFPGETAETLLETEDFIQNAGLDFYFPQLFYYLHHAPVHAQAEAFGLRGSGLLWSHATMDYREASCRMDEIFLKTDTLLVHQDYNLWEIAFLESKGFDRDRIRAHRRVIQSMTVAQMGGAPLTVMAD
jgi:p-methyltransferase